MRSGKSSVQLPEQSYHVRPKEKALWEHKDGERLWLWRPSTITCLQGSNKQVWSPSRNEFFLRIKPATLIRSQVGFQGGSWSCILILRCGIYLPRSFSHKIHEGTGSKRDLPHNLPWNHAFPNLLIPIFDVLEIEVAEESERTPTHCTALWSRPRTQSYSSWGSKSLNRRERLDVHGLDISQRHISVCCGPTFARNYGFDWDSL